MTPRLADLSTTAATDCLDDADVALLPTGATEQHGPHLPLGTDTRAARAVTERLDRDDVVSLPSIPVGVSDHHRQFPGTLSVSPETFAAYVRETVESLAAHGVEKVVVVNGHGGNDDALRRVARDLRRAERAFVVPWNWWANLADEHESSFGRTHVGHAGAAETSVVRAVAPGLVDDDALEDADAGAADTWGVHVAGAMVLDDVVDFSENGVVGVPTDGSAAAGERLLDAAVADLETLCAWLAARPFETLLPADRPGDATVG
jgi:creatinine amidohydrolase